MLSLLVEQDVSQKFVLLCFNIEHIQWTNTDLPHNCSGIMSSLHFVFLKKKKKKGRVSYSNNDKNNQKWSRSALEPYL